jgi:hypothetical protein
MIQLLAPLLGGLGGLLFPAAGAAAAGGAAATGIGALLSKAALPAIGAGLGTLVSGGNGKDAIRNALLMGVGVTALPDVARGIQQSGFGKSVTGGLANIFGMGAEPVSGPGIADVGMRGAYAPPRRPETTASTSAAPMTEIGAPMAPLPGTGQTGMEADARGRMPTTLPSLTAMAAIDNARSQQRAAEALDLALANPIMPSLQDMTIDAFGNAQDMGMGAPRMMPPTGEVARNMDVQRAMDMAAERGISSGRAMDLLGIANRRYSGRGFAVGGEVEGPGTGTSDSIPAEIYQDGKPVQKAALSDGEFVMTAKAVKGAGNGNRERGISRMYELMRRFESGEMA